ncbi:hypothetical protein [Mycolicibacterium aichiense]|uniref:Oxidoreductase, FAD-linked n=1 Tax=Mycolicibacterium aichiense TaxID=1799 RepID=A0AAD1MAB2_9MYCO|nr:hypothetical protein [Mycolicibacterium aichiense]MCV7020673.1 hypothetical protein [Mycolicibacterium aichiense]BBX05239.1 hypothetical protein MAIC_00420 [Mycolicibacterium aichiense]STZ25408.1 oxidoreductase, FAD-linked [Mycolicibacterium aichiense]
MTDSYGRIDAVAPGDLVALDQGSGEREYKVVHTQTTDTGFLITFEDDDGETFEHEFSADSQVKRSLDSKWESSQSPTPHSSE